jgi:Tfp pilus assembly protein PilX
MAKADSILKNQSGMALFIALIMIIVLTLIALASTYTSIFEIKLSGNKRASTDAFYAADAGVGEITTNVANFNLNSYDPKTNMYSPFSDKNNTTPNPTNAAANITYISGQSGPPRGMGFSAINLNYAYYQIASTGKDQADSSINPSVTTAQEEIVRLLPAPQ